MYKTVYTSRFWDDFWKFLEWCLPGRQIIPTPRRSILHPSRASQLPYLKTYFFRGPSLTGGGGYSCLTQGGLHNLLFAYMGLGRLWVQNTPTGCGNDLPARQTPFWEVSNTLTKHTDLYRPIYVNIYLVTYGSTGQMATWKMSVWIFKNITY